MIEEEPELKKKKKTGNDEKLNNHGTEENDEHEV